MSATSEGSSAAPRVGAFGFAAPLRARARLLSPFALALLVACGPLDVVVARIPDGGERPRPPPCSSSADCPPDGFCEKPDCAAALGRCQRRPFFCDDAAQPTCGCNNVTYWNDCLRRSAGEKAAVSGECGEPARCTTAADCPDGAGFCARLTFAAVCPASVEGACWAVPPTCGASTAGSFRACSGAATCTDVCTAIRAQVPFQRCL